jgi:hypothetical protein
VFTFVICLVAVGAVLAIAARIVMNGTPKPATETPLRGREPSQPVDAVVATPWWVRVRAVVLLSVLLALIGAFVALLIVLAGALVLSGLKNAVQQ